jgi:hypothetical protein
MNRPTRRHRGSLALLAVSGMTLSFAAAAQEPTTPETATASQSRSCESAQLTSEGHVAGSREMFGKMDGDRDGSLNGNEIQIAHDMMMTPDE